MREQMRRSAPVDQRPFKPIEKVTKEKRGETLYISYRNGRMQFCDNGGNRPVKLSLPKVRGYYE